MSDICVTLKDNQKIKLTSGQNSLDLAKILSNSLAKRVVAAKVNGQIKDVQDPLQDGDQVILLDNKSEEAQDVIAHSCEHILACAVIELFKDAQVTMGPKSHEEGFYYDFDIGRPFVEKDLEKIEQRMAKLIKDGISFKKRIVTKAKAKEIFKELNQKYKPEIIDWIPQDEVSIYESGSFVDLCRGPHLPNAKFIKAFKILGSSASYWRGDASREALQRVYGVAFKSKEELDEYLIREEEAKKRDHRKLGPKHDLFYVSERFSSWQDEGSKTNEIRVLVSPSQSLVKDGGINTLVQNIEGLIKEFTALMKNGLALKSFNINPAKDESETQIDIRVFATKDDAKVRKSIENVLAKYKEKNLKKRVQLHFDTSAHEDIGPGLVTWLPNGGKLRSVIEDFAKKSHFSNGYEMVYTPHIARSDLWRISGHLGFYQENMFAPMNVDGQEYLLKPMNCPFHVLSYKFKPKSYRDLPIRMFEFGTVYRYELAGVLHGLMRVRGFTQDDAHIFCTWEQLDNELKKVLNFIISVLSAFGFKDFEMNLSTRPKKFVGEEKDWERAEKSLKNTLEKSGFNFIVDEGGGAFYGPKIDVKLKDSIGRMWQCSTVQLDFNNPNRFDIHYINQEGKKERPLMLHRALFGSIERFIGILIEHYAAAFPCWLAPVQARVLTISDRQNDYAQKLEQELKKAGIRVEFYKSSDKLGAKIRKSQNDNIPLMLIIGDKEVDKDGATLRLRSEENKGFYKKDDLIQEIKSMCQIPSL